MISIVIPTYEQKGHGPAMLATLLNTIKQQKIDEPLEIIISDNSANNKVKLVVDYFKGLPITYYPNPHEIGHCENFNFALDRAKGSYIKLMCMDDVFMHSNSLNMFWQALKSNDWVISDSLHIDDFGRTKYRKKVGYDPEQWEKNITGMPSVIAYKRNNLRFNPLLRTYCDMWLYRQLFAIYGMPGIIRDYTIGQRFWRYSASRTLPPKHEHDRKLIKTFLQNDKG